MTHPSVIPIRLANASGPALALAAPPAGQLRRFHAMVKPSGAQCNLDCAYCFYLHKEDLLRQPKKSRMGDSVLEQHIRQYIEAHTGPEVVFSWQGGEPTLMGLDFFRRVIALQQQYKKPGQAIENDLQTNGILLDAAWCAFLKEHNFLVGLSIDGPSALHNAYRYSKGGTPSFERVMDAVALLRQYAIPFSALCVVNRVNARRPTDVYRFLRDQVRPRMIQFIPCVEPTDFQTVAPGHGEPASRAASGTAPAELGGAELAVTDWSVAPQDWGYFLNRIWDEWLRRDYGKVFVDQFENVISQMFGYGPQKCVSAQTCGKALAIEHNGDLYSCDHFVYPEYKLGNILQVHEGDLAFSQRQQAFGMAKHATLPGYCTACAYLELCWGDCPKNRFATTPEGEAGLSYLCAGLKQFYAKASAARGELSRRMES
ncbi:MAG: anaerobic sulfatase maturase [Rhodoferax sp.]|nr:anaerobic sulfatase maturase [Rhodoferax sp.]